MQNDQTNGRGESGGERPLRDTVDFHKIHARWREFRSKYPALDRSLSAVQGIRWHGIFATLRNRLLAGVLIAIPIIVTVWVLQIAFNFISTVSLPWLTAVGIRAPQWAAFAVTLLVLLGLGFMATNVIGARIIERTEKLLLKIPGVAPVFSATKQIIDAFKGMTGPTSFQRVVFVEYPSPGCRLMAFVTGQYVDPATGKNLTTVFLPTSPNPITGFVLVVDSERLVDAPFGLEEATKVVVSGGLVTPKGRMIDPGLAALSAGMPALAPVDGVTGQPQSETVLRTGGQPAQLAPNETATAAQHGRATSGARPAAGTI